MARIAFFCMGYKSFEIREIGDYWYEIIERRRRLFNRLTIDRAYANIIKTEFFL